MTRPRQRKAGIITPAAAEAADLTALLTTIEEFLRSSPAVTAGLAEFLPEHHPLQHCEALIRPGLPGRLLPGQLPQLLLHPHQLRVLPPELRVLLPQLPDLQGLLPDDHQRPRQQLLSEDSARRRRHGTARARQAPRHRSHERQQTPSERPRHQEHANLPQLTDARRRESLHRICEDLHFSWYYDNEHRHSGIAMHSPASAHDGSWVAVEARRALTLQAAYQAHPERFRRPPRPREMPAQAWINKPLSSPQSTQVA